MSTLAIFAYDKSVPNEMVPHTTRSKLEDKNICVAARTDGICSPRSGRKTGLTTAGLFVCLFQEARGKRPFKIWDSWRNVRKGLVVSSFEELVVRGT